MVTRKRFRAYLEAHQNEEFHRMSSNSCPLAGYFNQYADDASVGSDSVIYTSRANGRLCGGDLPKWAQQFIRQVDSEGKWNAPITGAEALEVLG